MGCTSSTDNSSSRDNFLSPISALPYETLNLEEELEELEKQEKLLKELEELEKQEKLLKELEELEKQEKQENLKKQLKEQFIEQLKEKLIEQLKEQFKEKFKEQLKELLKEQFKELFKELLKELFKELLKELFKKLLKEILNLKLFKLEARRKYIKYKYDSESLSFSAMIDFRSYCNDILSSCNDDQKAHIEVVMKSFKNQEENEELYSKKNINIIFPEFVDQSDQPKKKL
jgi:hypothetical protein